MTEQVQADLRARSPWAQHTGVKQVTLTAPAKLSMRHITVPGSKSYTNRALILAAAASGKTVLHGILRSDDSYWCCETLKSLGININISGTTAEVLGCGSNWPIKDCKLYLGAGGTTARFLPGILAASRSGNWLLEASDRMSKRPLEELTTALKCLGANIEHLSKLQSFPLKIQGAGLKGGPVTMSGKISSQFISGILMSAPLASTPITLNVTDGIVQHAYILITLSLMKAFGVDVSHNSDFSKFEVSPSTYVGSEITLEADASSSAYFLALAAITGNSITITNLNENTLQPDIKILDVLERMGCRIERSTQGITLSGPKKLAGNLDFNLREFSDQALTVAVMAPFADGPISIRGVAHIRHHECDRIDAIATLLRKLGINVEEYEDGLKVFPGIPVATKVCSYDDHRVAMSMGVLASRCSGLMIEDPGCVSKTFPSYFEMLQSAGYGVKFD